MSDRSRYLLVDKSTGNYGTPMPEAEALELISRPWVAESYTDENYAYAATLTILPVGWYWHNANPWFDDETPQGCRLILLRAKSDWDFANDCKNTIENAICECFISAAAELDKAGGVILGSPLSRHRIDDDGLIVLVAWLRERKFITCRL